MATKKKKTQRKKAPKKPTPKKQKGNGVEAQIEREDLLLMQIAVKDLENAQLRTELLQLRAERAPTAVEQAQQVLQKLSAQANEKYKLTPGEDSFDLGTGTITRGTQEK